MWHTSSPQSNVVDIVPDLRRLLPELQGASLNDGLHSFVSVVHQDVQATVLLVFDPLEQLVDLLVVLVVNLNWNASATTVSDLE